MKRIFFLVSALCIGFTAYLPGQRTSPTLSFSLEAGFNSYYNEGLLAATDARHFLSAAAEYSFPTRPTVTARGWEMPEWGLGVHHIDMRNPGVLGSATAVYAFVDMPVRPRLLGRRWELGYRLGMGAALGMTTWDAETNPAQILIGSATNAYVELGGYYHCSLTPRSHLRAAAHFFHYSNGAQKKPNLGMNLVGLRLTYGYALRGERTTVPDPNPAPEPRFRPRHGAYLFQAVGFHQIVPDGERYRALSTSFGYAYQSGHRHRWLLGVDLFHDLANNSGARDYKVVPAADRDNPANPFMAGLSLGHEAIWNRWSLHGAWGFYVHRRYRFLRPNYQRIGVRYRAWEGLQLGVGLKAKSFGADYLEYSVNYLFMR